MDPARCPVRARAGIGRGAVLNTGSYTGRARLVFERRGAGTVLGAASAEMPLKYVRPFHAGDGRAVLQLLNISPGAMAGDRYQIDIEVRSGAHAVVMSPSATKVHRMEGAPFASQQVRLAVQEGATLEYYPPLTIPFPGSDFRQSVQIELASTARLAYVEAWSMGRIERGEALRFRRLEARTRITVDGRPAYQDALQFEPEVADPSGYGLLEGGRYVVSGVWFGPPVAFPFDGPAGRVAAGPSPLPGISFLRAIPSASAELQTVLAGARHAAASWGFETVDLHPFTC